MRVLITGGAGLLGLELQATFDRRQHDVFAPGHSVLDVSDRDAVLHDVSELAPDLVIHAAAWTDVDGAESEPERAMAVNALGTRHVAEAAQIADAHLVYVSTDYVFDGLLDRPYHEWDDPGPLSVYGRSKLGGERELPESAAIVRTSWLFGVRQPSIVSTILRLARERDELAFVTDQIGRPTEASGLAEVMYSLAIERAPGTYHVTHQGSVSWYELAREVFTAAGLDPDRVQPILTAELEPARPAPRPANSALDNAALRLQGRPLLPDHTEPLSSAVAQLLRAG